MRLLILLIINSLFITSISLAQDATQYASTLPERGIDKAAVESKFGAPNRKIAPVGDPPITRWVYKDFTVVFEYSHVVHAYKRSDMVENISTSDLPDRPDLTLPPASAESTPVAIKPPVNESSSTAPEVPAVLDVTPKNPTTVIDIPAAADQTTPEVATKTVEGTTEATTETKAEGEATLEPETESPAEPEPEPSPEPDQEEY